MIRTIFISILITTALACAKSEQKAQETEAAKTEPAPTEAKPEEPKKEEPSPDEELVQFLKESQESAQKEQARWTDELHAQVKELVAKDFADAKSALEEILKSGHRVPKHAARDQYRHPLETLTFFGIRPDMTVLEAGAGNGWYSDILSALVAKKGQLIISTFDPDAPLETFRPIIGQRVKLFMARSPELYGNAKMVVIDPPDKLTLGEPDSVDMVLAFREMHNWVRGEFFGEYLQAIHAVLKPGGVLGVVQHRAKADAKAEESAENGYLPEEWLIKQAEAAGFKLEARSEINANPKDTKDYEGGVWMLPPSSRGDDKDRAKYEAIGESDRMTLKFVKVAK